MIRQQSLKLAYLEGFPLLIAKSPVALSVAEICKVARAHPRTVTKYLCELERRGKVRQKVLYSTPTRSVVVWGVRVEQMP